MLIPSVDPILFCGQIIATGNFWLEHDLTEKLLDVLSDVTYFRPDHHFGRSFLTAYQLAILIKARFPGIFQCYGHPIGGKGSGDRNSFSRYLAGQLSQKILSRKITDIQGGFLSNRQLVKIKFDDAGDPVVSSLTESQYDLYMFRYTG